MGDPVGNPESFLPLIWDFREKVDLHSGWPVFYQISARHLTMYLDIGLTLLKIGEEAHVDLKTFSMEGGSKKHLRNTQKKIEQEGFSFEIVPNEKVETILPELKTISDEWLAHKKTREKRFSLGYFNETYLKENPVALVQKEGKIVAFANMWLTGSKHEASIDLMRYSKDAPKNVMDYLFINLLLWGKENGYAWFNLGMAPFAGIDVHKFGTLWNKLGAFLYNHGETIYNFQGLRQFKDKYDPLWVPKYLAVPGGFSLPLILRDVSSLISGGIKGVFSK
jgi:phosphatidylglycerol lysyltransferase